MASEIKGSYGTLTANAGKLIGQTAIEDVPGQEAADEADRVIDDKFSDFDRASWTDGNPEKITRAWLLIATGEYLDSAQGVNVTDPERSRADRLIRQGYEMLEEVRSAGGPVMADGSKATPRGGSTDDDRAITIAVT